MPEIPYLVDRSLKNNQIDLDKVPTGTPEHSKDKVVIFSSIILEDFKEVHKEWGELQIKNMKRSIYEKAGLMVKGQLIQMPEPLFAVQDGLRLYFYSFYDKEKVGPDYLIRGFNINMTLLGKVKEKNHCLCKLQESCPCMEIFSLDSGQSCTCRVYTRI